MLEHSCSNEPAVSHMTRFDTVAEAIESFARGEFVVVVDDHDDGENGGKLVIAADAVTEEKMAWMMRHASDEIWAPMTTPPADRLQLPAGGGASSESFRPASTRSIALVVDDGPGASAGAHARTLAGLVHPAHTAREFRSPGHVLAVRARPGGVLTGRESVV